MSVEPPVAMLITRNEAAVIVGAMETTDDEGQLADDAAALLVRMSAEFGESLFERCPWLLRRVTQRWEGWTRP